MSLATQIRDQLQALNLPPPSQPWLQALITARSPPPPLPSLVMTAKTRLLASDLTTPGLLDPSATAPAACLPPGTVAVTTTTTTGTGTGSSSSSSSPPSLPPPSRPPSPSPSPSPLATRESRLASDVHVQVVGLEDLSRSRWEQVEELDAVERGERTRGREVIRLPVSSSNNNNNNNNNNSSSNSNDHDGNDGGGGGGGGSASPSSSSSSSSRNATHRLVLQDCRGQRAFALELARIPRISAGAPSIGEKILLRRGTVVARGTIMLEPGTCLFLGGRVEPWQRAWVGGRLARLRGAVGPGGLAAPEPPLV